MIQINRNSKYFKIILFIASILIANILGTILVIGAYNLPTEPIKNNIQKSLKIYETEHDYYSWAPTIINTQLDNWTDSIIINIVGFERGNSFKEIVHNAMTIPYYGYNNAKHKSDYIIKAYSQQPKKESTHFYARYWHGYVVLLKPLLSFFTMSDIRIINMFIQILLFLIFISELMKAGGKKMAYPFLLTVLLLNPISCAMSMMFASVYCITLISAIIQLKWKLYKSEYYYLLYLWIGIITSFWDFLSYPLVTLGYNLILFVLLTQDRLFDKLQKIFISSISWGIGYASMWSGKWIIGYLLSGNNILKEAIDAIKIRTTGGTSYGDNSVLGAINRNLQAFNNNVFLSLLVLGIAFYLIQIFRGRYKVRIEQNIIIPLFLIALYPFIWVTLLKNHSIVHYWFVHRIFSITIIATICAITYSTKQNDYQRNLKDIIQKKHIIYLISIILLIYGVILAIPTIARVDVHYAYKQEPSVEVIMDNQRPSEAAFMPKYGNRGFSLEKKAKSMTFTIKALKDEIVNVSLRGPYEIDPNKKQKKIKYTDFRINGERILSEPVETWHDNPFKYVLKAEKGRIYKIELKWRKK